MLSGTRPIVRTSIDQGGNGYVGNQEMVPVSHRRLHTFLLSMGAKILPLARDFILSATVPSHVQGTINVRQL